jgi:hypothetical protein
MGAAQVPAEVYQLLQSGELTILDPGSGGTFDLRGRDGGIATIASGTRKLPDNMPRGVSMYVYATGAVTITSVAGTTVAVLASGDLVKFTAKTSTTWGAGGSSGAAGVSIADANSDTAATTVEAAIQELLTRTDHAIATTYNNTDATGTLTAAAIVGGVIIRTGETAAYTDTTDTAVNILAAIGTDSDDKDWFLLFKNTVAFTATLTGGTDVTLAGQTKIPPNSTGLFHVANAGESFVITGLGSMPECRLPNGQYNTTAAASPVTPAAGILTGANHVFYEVTTDGAFGITTRTATELFGDIPNCHIGFTYLLTIVNRGNATITITAGANVTITASENTIATLVTRTYLVNFTSATACTWSSLTKGTIET